MYACECACVCDSELPPLVVDKRKYLNTHLKRANTNTHTHTHPVLHRNSEKSPLI